MPIPAHHPVPRRPSPPGRSQPTMAKWGDLLEEEEELPPSTTSGPDGKGVVTKVEYYRNEKGEVMKKVTKTRVVKIEKKVYQVMFAALGRRGRPPLAPPPPLPPPAAAAACARQPH